MSSLRRPSDTRARTPLPVLPEEYGAGSSRLGRQGTSAPRVRAVIAASYERIHALSSAWDFSAPIPYGASAFARLTGLERKVRRSETFTITGPPEASREATVTAVPERNPLRFLR